MDDITARSDKCTSAGKPAIQIDQYQGQDQATAAVVSGKDEAMLADSPVIAYAVEQTHGQMELLGTVYDSAPYGNVVAKKDTAFAEALPDAVAVARRGRHLQEGPRLLGRRLGAIDNPQVNPAAASVGPHDGSRPARPPRADVTAIPVRAPRPVGGQRRGRGALRDVRAHAGHEPRVPVVASSGTTRSRRR